MTIGTFADWASIISLLVGIFNAVQITSVRRRVMLNVTLEALSNRLQESSRDINRCLLNYEASVDDLDRIVGVCEADVRALRRRFGYRNGRFCKALLVGIATYRRDRSEEAARGIYNVLQETIRETANRAEEMRIIGP